MTADRGARTTSGDVARLAGVSRAAVSRVFTPGASASKGMAEKVQRAAAKLGYRPNVLARSLNTGETRIIGLVVAYLHNTFYVEAVERMSIALQERSYHILLFRAAPTVRDVDRVMQEILDHQVDGIVLGSVTMSSSLAQECRRRGIPVVQFNLELVELGLNAVVTDNRAGGRAIADLLVSAGHRRLGYIAGFEGAPTQRERGFREGLEAAGTPLAARGPGNFVLSEAQEATRRMFDRADHPDAVFVCNDHMAFAVMDVLRSELGLRIPEDVSVAGFDDVPIAAWPAYSLTTYRQPINRMVAETVAILLAEVAAGAASTRRVVIEGDLVVRHSARDAGPALHG